MKKIVLVIAFEGYQPIEYREPKRILENAGFEVVTASDQIGTAKATYDGSVTQVDMLVENIDPKDYDGLFLIGGSGALEHLDNKKIYELLQAWQESGKPFGANCISPRILAGAGVLKNKKATGWNDDGRLAGIFEEFNVEYIQENVVVDGNVITANGPEMAEEFGEAVIKLFEKKV